MAQSFVGQSELGKWLSNQLSVSSILVEKKMCVFGELYFLAQHIYLHTQPIITETRKALQQREDRVRDQLPQFSDIEWEEREEEEEEEVRMCVF